MATKIDTVTARDGLKTRHAPYWQKIRAACHLGFRKTTSASIGSWIARYRDSDGKYQLNSLGSLDQFPAHRRFDEAVKLAGQWFDHRSSGGTAVNLSVGQACQRYVEKLRSDGRVGGVTDAEGRFKRWIHSDPNLSSLPVMKLTPGIVGDWRSKLAKTPAALQDKRKTATKLRSSSSLNRDMAVLKAALNLAIKDGHATSDAAWKNKLLPIKDAGQRRDCYLDRDQRRTLIANAPKDLAIFLEALSRVPLRPGAVAALVTSNFDKRLSVLTVGKDKSGRDRKITLPPMTAAFFSKQVADRQPESPLFRQENGKPWNKDAWKKPFKVAAADGNLPLSTTAYAFRHSTITDLIALHRLDTMTVAHLSGTSLAMIEKHYGHLLQEHAATALAALVL